MTLQGKKTYIIGGIIIFYATIFRGFGANDWAGAAGMISTALVGMCLRHDFASSCLPKKI